MSIKALSFALLLLALPTLAAAPASAVVALCTTSTTVPYATAEAGHGGTYGTAEVAATATFVDDSAEPTGAFTGATTTITMNYAAALLRGDYVGGSLTFVGDEADVAIVYALAEAGPAGAFAGATVDNTVAFAHATAAITVPYATQLPGCVLSDVTPLIPPMTLA